MLHDYDVEEEWICRSEKALGAVIDRMNTFLIAYQKTTEERKLTTLDLLEYEMCAMVIATLENWYKRRLPFREYTWAMIDGWPHTNENDPLYLLRKPKELNNG